MPKKSKTETDRDGETCNTKKVSQPNQVKNHFLTWNNYPPNGIEILETKFKEIAKSYVFQTEIGKGTEGVPDGTPHIQGCLVLWKEARWSEFKLPKQIHWEKTKDNDAAVLYCSKDETYDGVRVTKGLPKPINIINPDRPWQVEILNLIKGEPDDRKVYWYWDDIGGVGKSSFCKYLIVKHHAVFIDEGKKSDLMNIMYNADMDATNLVVIDIPRSNKNISYKSIESIKNGVICNTKYETGTKCFNSPFVIVFSNFTPDYEQLSQDRWIVKKIE